MAIICLYLFRWLCYRGISIQSLYQAMGNPEDIKIACLPAVIIPGKFKEMLKSADKRLLVDACSLRCGAKLFEREGMTVDSYLELTSKLRIKKEKILPSADLQEEVYLVIKSEVENLLVI